MLKSARTDGRAMVRRQSQRVPVFSPRFWSRCARRARPDRQRPRQVVPARNAICEGSCLDNAAPRAPPSQVHAESTTPVLAGRVPHGELLQSKHADPAAEGRGWRPRSSGGKPGSLERSTAGAVPGRLHSLRCGSRPTLLDKHVGVRDRYGRKLPARRTRCPLNGASQPRAEFLSGADVVLQRIRRPPARL